jgi:hypothetical protein
MVASELLGHQRSLADGSQTAEAVRARPRSAVTYAVESESTADLPAAHSDSEPLDCDSEPQAKPVLLSRKYWGNSPRLGGTQMQ